MGFPFLFGVCVAAMTIIGLVDVEKGREDCRRFVEARKVPHVGVERGLTDEAYEDDA